jgi:hypothetical protein
VCETYDLYFHVIWPWHHFQSKCQCRLANSKWLHLLDAMKTELFHCSWGPLLIRTMAPWTSPSYAGETYEIDEIFLKRR